MPRPNSGKNWERATFSLEKEIKKQIKDISSFEGMSQSQFISFLVTNWDTGLDINDKITKCIKAKKELKIKIDEEDEKIEELNNQSKVAEEWRNSKGDFKEDAIKILTRKILENDRIGAEKVARGHWQRITGVPALQLLVEANKRANSGI